MKRHRVESQDRLLTSAQFLHRTPHGQQPLSFFPGDYGPPMYRPLLVFNDERGHLVKETDNVVWLKSVPSGRDAELPHQIKLAQRVCQSGGIGRVCRM